MRILVLLLASLPLTVHAFTLSCPEFGNLEIENVGPDATRINVKNYIGSDWRITQQPDGDCVDRDKEGLVCFQEGQFMINIPQKLMNGEVASGDVWINDDTDDNDSNDRKGATYDCKIERMDDADYKQTMTDKASAKLAAILKGHVLSCMPVKHEKPTGFYPLTVHATDLGDGQTELFVATHDPDQNFSGSGNYYEVHNRKGAFTIKDGDDDWNILTIPEFTLESKEVAAQLKFLRDDGSADKPTQLNCEIK